MGSLPAPPPVTPYHLWPENWPVWCLWRELETQWRHGFAGPTGLDHAVMRAAVADRLRPRHRRTAVWLLQAMEDATLDEWRHQRRQQQRST